MSRRAPIIASVVTTSVCLIAAMLILSNYRRDPCHQNVGAIQGTDESNEQVRTARLVLRGRTWAVERGAEDLFRSLRGSLERQRISEGWTAIFADLATVADHVASGSATCGLIVGRVGYDDIVLNARGNTANVVSIPVSMLEMVFYCLDAGAETRISLRDLRAVLLAQQVPAGFMHGRRLAIPSGSDRLGAWQCLPVASHEMICSNEWLVECGDFTDCLRWSSEHPHDVVLLPRGMISDENSVLAVRNDLGPGPSEYRSVSTVFRLVVREMDRESTWVAFMVGHFGSIGFKGILNDTIYGAVCGEQR